MTEVAIVTGAARRIGAMVARTLAQAGYDVALHVSQRSRDEAEGVAADVRALGRRAIVLCADLADAHAVAALTPAAAALGPVTLLVNSASLFAADAPGVIDAALWDPMFAVNLRAPVALSAAVFEALPANREGVVVNIIDQRVWRLNPQYFTYTLTKSALWTATQTAAQAFAPRMRVNAVAPGPVLPNALGDRAAFDHEVAGTPLARPVGPVAIAEAVLYLARARSVTGVMLPVDAGQHLAWRTPDVVDEPNPRSAADGS